MSASPFTQRKKPTFRRRGKKKGKKKRQAAAEYTPCDPWVASITQRRKVMNLSSFPIRSPMAGVAHKRRERDRSRSHNRRLMSRLGVQKKEKTGVWLQLRGGGKKGEGGSKKVTIFHKVREKKRGPG